MNQNLLTIIVGILCTAIPLTSLAIAVSRTPKHGFACTRCNADVPPGSTRCPSCGAVMVDQDQAL